MSDDAIERLRAHLEKHKHREQVFVSVDGLQAVFNELDRLQTVRDRMEWLRAQVEKLSDDKCLLIAQRDELKAQRDELKVQVDTQARQFREFVERDADDAVELRRQRDKLRFQIEHLEACVTIHDRNRKELKAQVERLLAKEGERIGKELRRIEKYEGESNGEETKIQKIVP